MRNISVKDCSLLLLISAVIYLPFLGFPAWYGNETIRVIVAKEMLHSGNWIMPVLHGNPYLAKPPLMNWLIAASAGIFGGVNEWTSRLPSVLMMVLNSLSVYLLTRKWLGREGRLFAAVMVLCMTGLMEKGREAEIDSLHIFVLSFILLVWIHGYLSQWSPTALWGLSLMLVGIGFLSKGPQVIFFFYMTVIPYLLWKKRMSLFFSRGHAFGLVLFLLVISLYLLSVLQWTTLAQYAQTWVSEGMQRTEGKVSFLQHIIQYPFELILSFMPCLLFLIPLALYKDLRQELMGLMSSDIFVFSIVVIAANFPLYWLLPNMRPRYFLPAAPFIALGTGVIFDLYLNKLHSFPAIKIFFKRFLTLFAILLFMASAAAIPAVLLLHLDFTFSLLVLMACALSVSVFAIIKSCSRNLSHVPLHVAFITAFLFLLYTNLEIQYDSKQENNSRNIAREINRLIPGDVDTVYEIGYRRFLGITCYLDREVHQIDTFAELQSLGKQKRKIYFIFDTVFLNRGAGNEDKNIFLREIVWKKIYSIEYKSSKGEIVVGTLS
jgi:4-amino-4-deoxy-L-arabinose transferase-like glycosyltransferase